MGSSMGCVRPPREREQAGAAPHSPKKRLRFRRKHKGIKNRRGEREEEGCEQQQGFEPEKEEGEKESTSEAELHLSSQAATLITVPHAQFTHSSPYSNILSVSGGSSVVGLFSGRNLDVSPKPSPAWKGIFCLPGEEDSISAIIDVSSIPSQTTITPVKTSPSLGSTTPGGGRVCRVRQKAQGIVEKPWILRPRREKRDKGRTIKHEGEHGGEGGGWEEMPTVKEHKGVIHIRQVDGELCLVRTVYPSDYSSPVWMGKSHGVVEVHKEPPAPSPVTENILKVQLADEDGGRSETSLVSNGSGKGFRFDAPACERHKSQLLESGYASDLPPTSPETAGTTPSQPDWGGLTSSSSERLDSVMESPLSLQQPATAKHPQQVCVWTLLFRELWGNVRFKPKNDFYSGLELLLSNKYSWGFL